MKARPHGPNLIAAIACFTLSAALAVASVLFVIVTMREYGPGEGFGDVAGQSLPFAIAGWSWRWSWSGWEGAFSKLPGHRKAGD